MYGRDGRILQKLGKLLTLCYIIVNVFVNIVYSTAITIELNERLSVLARRAI